MTSRRHPIPKSPNSHINQLPSPDLPFRSPISLSQASSTSQPAFAATKSLLGKLFKPQARPRHQHVKTALSPKVGKSRKLDLKMSKSISMSLKEGNFEIDSSKELSAIRPDSGKTPRTDIRFKGFLAETSSIKSTPKVHSVGDYHKEQFDSQVISLELKLTEQLKALNKSTTLPTSFETQFPIYEKVFQEVIDRDRQFGSLLIKIKVFYESWLRSFSKNGKSLASEQLFEQCGEQLRAARQKLKLCSEEKKLMLRRIGNLSKETVELNQSLEDLEVENEQLKAKLEAIKSIDMAEFPKSDEAWKYLIVENQNYYQENRRLRHKIRVAESQADTLQLLVQRMGDRGFPIDELEERLLSSLENSKTEDLEPITTGPAKSMEKPKNVPKLRLAEVRNFEAERMTSAQEEGDSGELEKALDSQAEIGLEEFNKMVQTRETVAPEDDRKDTRRKVSKAV